MTTVAVIKPGALARHGLWRVLSGLDGTKLRMVGGRVQHWTPDEAVAFYLEHRGKPFFDGLVEHAVSGPCFAMFLTHPVDPVSVWRDLIGPTDPRQGGGLRALFGVGLPDNGLHGSSDSAAAAREEQLLASFHEPLVFSDRMW